MEQGLRSTFEDLTSIGSSSYRILTVLYSRLLIADLNTLQVERALGGEHSFLYVLPKSIMPIDWLAVDRRMNVLFSTTLFPLYERAISPLKLNLNCFQLFLPKEVEIGSSRDVSCES